MSKTTDILVGIVLCSVTSYTLALYFPYLPDFDIWIFLIIVVLNLLQCLPDPSTQT